MYHQPSKRRQLIKRIAVYGLMTIVTVGLVTVLVFIMLGYQFNRSDGKIEQGGLVQFESRPSGADVFIDGNNLGTRTSSKTTATAGSHFIKMERQGYQSWQKSINVVPGSVLWLNYARLIPNERPVSQVADLTAVSSTAASFDNKWMAIKENPATPVIRLADLSADKVELTNLTLPADSYTKPGKGKKQSFSVQKWDPDDRFILVKHVYDDAKTEWLVVEAERPANTKNITALLGIDVTKVVFSNNDSTILYVLVDNNLRKIDLDAATLSGPLLTGIGDFDLYDDSVITYVTLLDSTKKTRSVGYYHDGADKPRTIRSYHDTGKTPLHLQIDKYFDDTYAAISYGENIEILRGDLPRSDAKNPSVMKPVETMTVPGGISHLSTMTNGRFVVAQSGEKYTVYDQELEKMTTTTVKGKAKITKEFDWLDSYTLLSDRDGTLRFYEFDGANQHDIMTVVPGFNVMLSPNGTYVYGIVKADDGTLHLGRVRLILS